MVSEDVLREMFSGDRFLEKKRGAAAVQTDARRDVYSGKES